MWRLWTRGWGPRDWWYWFVREGFPLWVAWHIPKRIALWTFIRVYSNGIKDCPGEEYRTAYDAWGVKD